MSKGKETSQASRLSAKGDLHADGLQDVGHDQTGPPWDHDPLLLAAAPQRQPQVLLERQKAPFDLPASHREPSDLPQRPEQRRAHSADVLPDHSPTAQAHQPHDMACSGIVGSAPVQAIEGVSVLGGGMHTGGTGLLPPARHPSRVRIGQLIEPLKPKGVPIGQDEDPVRERCSSRSRMLLAMLAHLRDILDGSPLLQTHITERHPLAWQQERIPCVSRTQDGSAARQRISPQLIQGPHRPRQRSELAPVLLVSLLGGLKPRRSESTDLGNELLQGTLPSCSQRVYTL